MIIGTDYRPGMFVNTRKFFDSKIKFLIKCNGNVIAKFEPEFKIKNTKNFLDIIREVKQNKKYKNLKILYITIINDDKFLLIQYWTTLELSILFSNGSSAAKPEILLI